MQQTVTFYIEANVVCAIIFIILLIHNRFSIDRQEKQIQFGHALAAFILYFIMDCVCMLVVADYIPKTPISITISSFLIYLSICMITYRWLCYVLALEQVATRSRSLTRFAILFPFLFSTILLILNYIIAPHLLFDEKLNTTIIYDIFLMAVPIIYMGAILFYSLRKARLEENPLEKRRHLFVGLLPLMVIVGGAIQTIFLSYLPIFCFVSLILIILFYIQSMAGLISRDPLTNLNNRSHLMRYISQRSNLHQEGRHTVVVMMDIDRFKSINDTYGHAEGDRALVIVASSLKSVTKKHNDLMFLGRYGGDEFIAIIHPHRLEEADALIREFRCAVEEQVREEELAYEISISAGYAELLGEPDTIQNCIVRADKKLYLEKAQRKQSAV